MCFYIPFHQFILLLNASQDPKFGFQAISLTLIGFIGITGFLPMTVLPLLQRTPNTLEAIAGYFAAKMKRETAEAENSAEETSRTRSSAKHE